MWKYTEKGIFQKCEEGYFLNVGDKNALKQRIVQNLHLTFVKNPHHINLIISKFPS